MQQTEESSLVQVEGQDQAQSLDLPVSPIDAKASHQTSRQFYNPEYQRSMQCHKALRWNPHHRTHTESHPAVISTRLAHLLTVPFRSSLPYLSVKTLNQSKCPICLCPPKLQGGLVFKRKLVTVDCGAFRKGYYDCA